MGGVRVNGLLCVERGVDESELERCVWQRERNVKRSKSPSCGHSESCKAPTRPPSAKVWVPAIVGDDVIADFALTLQFGRFDTAVAGQCNQLGHVTLTLLHPLLPSLQP